MTMQEPDGHVFDLLDLVREKLTAYNPDARNAEVLHSAIGTLRAAKTYYEEFAARAEIKANCINLTNHLISLERPDIEFQGELPDVRDTHKAALAALASLRNELVKHKSIQGSSV